LNNQIDPELLQRIRSRYRLRQVRPNLSRCNLELLIQIPIDIELPREQFNAFLGADAGAESAAVAIFAHHEHLPLAHLPGPEITDFGADSAVSAIFKSCYLDVCAGIAFFAFIQKIAAAIITAKANAIDLSSDCGISEWTGDQFFFFSLIQDINSLGKGYFLHLGARRLTLTGKHHADVNPRTGAVPSIFPAPTI